MNKTTFGFTLVFILNGLLACLPHDLSRLPNVVMMALCGAGAIIFFKEGEP